MYIITGTKDKLNTNTTQKCCKLYIHITSGKINVKPPPCSHYGNAFKGYLENINELLWTIRRKLQTRGKVHPEQSHT